jgi:hypothetical protein
MQKLQRLSLLAVESENKDLAPGWQFCHDILSKLPNGAHVVFFTGDRPWSRRRHTEPVMAPKARVPFGEGKFAVEKVNI